VNQVINALEKVVIKHLCKLPEKVHNQEPKPKALCLENIALNIMRGTISNPKSSLMFVLHKPMLHKFSPVVGQNYYNTFKAAKALPHL